MIIERHYDDEALIALMENDRDRTDPHLPSCEPCSGKLESFRIIAGALEERDVWDTRTIHNDPVPATIKTLRAFADRMSFEDTQAETYVRELLAGPRDTWMPRLQQHPEWRTAGVVRRLVAMTTPTIMTMPPDGLEMTALSTEIADRLDPAKYPSDTVARLRGAAWRDRAYALFYVGRFTDSLTATERADLHLQSCVVDEYDRARVAIVRALSLRAKEEFATAMAEARSSADTFAYFGDTSRLVSARMAEAQLLFSRSDFETAARLLHDLERQIRDTADSGTHARVLGNLGYCYWKLGRIDEALRHHEASAALHTDNGVITEAVRARWNVAVILAAAGRVDEALLRYDALRATFEQLSMTSEAALVSLDIAELLIVRNEFSRVEEICRAAMRSFEAAGISYTARALTALAYMREAAQSRVATPHMVKHVREYLRRLPQDGELLFAPPPPESFLANSR